jgi:hypothetical protein
MGLTFEYSATVPSGYKVVDGLKERFNSYYIMKDLHLMGNIEGTTPFGNTMSLKTKIRYLTFTYNNILKTIMDCQHLSM